MSQFSSTGIPISGPLGYISALYRVQGTVSDKNNNIWMASYGNDRIVVYLNGDPNSAIYYQEPANSGPFDIAIAQDGSAWVSNSKTSAGNPGSVINKYVISGSQLIKTLDVQLPAGSSTREVSLDSQGNAWVASVNDSTIYKIAPNGTFVAYNGQGGVSGPWGVTVDGDDNIWVANFEGIGFPPQFSISKLCGINTAKCPTGLTTGDAISPSTGYTLPSAGSQVLLADGTPLNGVGGPPSFNPLMRLTHAISDQAGNVWAANNWKPLPFSDNYFNPGGDGMVVFIGIAAPPQMSQ
ncbi:NHL repeat protein [Legionella cherrii]|uniref:NHL repeat protein n=1 Tax=Legionella cherrii TaxID=28084 RepID=A0A0W0S9Y3_9GAMM|nr:NHL repeat protein [Legionella cherrii]